MSSRGATTVYLENSSDTFGPIDWKVARMFWAYGLIPPGTLVRFQRDDQPTCIEGCEKLNGFPKRLTNDTQYFKGNTLLSQKARVSAAQITYLKELGWPFDVAHFNYYQIDFLRKQIETIFPDRLRPFVDPENPWWPGSRKPMNVEAATGQQRRYLQLLGLNAAEELTALEAGQLINKYDTPEAQAAWNEARNEWKRLPISNRQHKVLKFFGLEIPLDATRGAANSLITRIFASEENRLLWTRYKVLTGDYGHESPDLRQFDRSALETIEIDADTDVEDFRDLMTESE